MLPPSPPSPPLGPPRGTNFSRRKLTQPAPPSPALTKISISSTNIRPPGGRRGGSGGGGGDAHVARVAPPLEADVALGPGVQGVGGAAAHVVAWLERRPALPDGNTAGGDGLRPA